MRNFEGKVAVVTGGASVACDARRQPDLGGLIRERP